MRRRRNNPGRGRTIRARNGPTETGPTVPACKGPTLVPTAPRGRTGRAGLKDPISRVRTRPTVLSVPTGPDRPQRPDRPDWNRPGRPDAARPDRPNRPGFNRDRDYREFHNRWNRDQWRRDWDRRHRSDWWRNDSRFRGWSGVRIGFYFAPGYGYYSVPRSYWNRQYYVGQYLPDVFWRYQVNDWRTYGLGYPPPGTRWVYVDNSIYLIDDYDGYIIEVVRDAWRW